MKHTSTRPTLHRQADTKPLVQRAAIAVASALASALHDEVAEVGERDKLPQDLPLPWLRTLLSSSKLSSTIEVVMDEDSAEASGSLGGRKTEFSVDQGPGGAITVRVYFGRTSS